MRLLGFARLLPLAVLSMLLLRGADQMSIEAFIKPDAFDEVCISPDGTRLAALARWKNHLQLYIIDIATAKPRMITGYDNEDVSDVSWRDNQFVSFRTVRDHRYSRFWRLAAADGSGVKADNSALRWNVTLSNSREHPDDHILGSYAEAEDALFIYRYNDRKRFKTIIESIPQAHWAGVDLNEDCRIAIGSLPDEVTVKAGPDAKFERWILSRKSKTDPWRRVLDYRSDRCRFWVLHYAPDNRLVYVITDYGRPTQALVLFDPETGKIVRELLSDPVYDVGQPIYSWDWRTLLGCTILREHYETVWFDERLAKIQSMIDQKLPGKVNRFTSMSQDLSRIVLLSSSDTDYGTYYLIDAKTLAVQRLIELRPWMSTAPLAPMKPVLYKARDGVQVHGYLTLPVGVEPRGLPMVVVASGGPWERNYQGIDTLTQFLANRGYAVFQINPRGSIGYGRAFRDLGVGQLGLKMQDDVTDGVRWCIDQGIADRDRIGIHGFEFGGFMAMSGLALTPELYRCGVSYAGITDLDLLVKTAYSEEIEDPAELLKEISDRGYDPKHFGEVSPLRMASKIKAPVYLVYGELDGLVDFKHGSRLASALRKNGVPVEWLLRSQEGHGYRIPENILVYYKTLETFLARNLAPRK
jgi:dipeptidyl aminopeptidase/acylaminoacyl peptidase